MADGGGQRRRRREMVDRPFAKVGEVRREIACKTEIEGVRSRERKRKRERGERVLKIGEEEGWG